MRGIRMNYERAQYKKDSHFDAKVLEFQNSDFESMVLPYIAAESFFQYH